MYKSKFGGPSTHRVQPMGCVSLFPRRRSEKLALWDCLQRNEVEVGCVEVNGVAPPVQLLTATWVNDSEEDHKSSHGETEVKSK